MSTTATVAHLPYCDLDKDHGLAWADARLPAYGSWAFVCRTCFADCGCALGTGRGQRLVLEGSGDDVNAR